MKVGILTLPLRGNYGGVIQAYALQRFLKKNEIDAHLINRKWDLTREPGLIYKIQRFIFQNVFWRQVLSFSERMILPRTRVIRSQEEMQLIGKQDYNAFVVGSDQVWRVEFTGGVGDNYFLDFVNDPKILKISYAASFGTDIWKGSPQQTAKIKKLIMQFNSVSVREKSGLELCKKHFGIEAKHVLDPAFLLSKEDYIELLPEKYNKSIKSKLITYVLDENPKIKEHIKHIAKSQGLEVQSINVKKDPNNLRKRIHFNVFSYVYPSVYQWLRGFRDAEFIITDSFHGTVFSIIFQKQFIVLGNEHRGLSRFLSLLSLLGLEDRLTKETSSIQDLMDISMRKIDYDKINKILQIEIDNSKEFLLSSLKR